MLGQQGGLSTSYVRRYVPHQVCGISWQSHACHFHAVQPPCLLTGTSQTLHKEAISWSKHCLCMSDGTALLVGIHVHQPPIIRTCKLPEYAKFNQLITHQQHNAAKSCTYHQFWTIQRCLLGLRWFPGLCRSQQR